MEAASYLVIKVKYGDVLRRFNARVVGDELDISVDGLREKICSLFSFSPESELVITYVDEDGDVVTLVDDSELWDAVKQDLNPLRITVQLKAEKDGGQVGKSTSLRSASDHNGALDLSDIVKLACDAVQGVADVLDSKTKEKTDGTPAISTIATGDQDGAQSKTDDTTSKVLSPEKKSTNGKEVSKEPQSEASAEVKSGNVASVSKLSGGPNIVFSSKKTFSAAERKAILMARARPSGEKSKTMSSAPPSGSDNLTGGNARHVVKVGKTFTKTKLPNNNTPTSTGNFVFPSIPPRPTASVTHHGVQCDYCGIHPITGPRFKSIVKEDYDLCRYCHYKVGNEEDYMKMDYPAPGAYQALNPFQNGIYNAQARVCGSAIKIGGGSKLSSRFIRDVNVVDGTTVAPLTSFTKTWRMRNNGNIVWPKKTQLIWVGGDKLCNGISFELDIPEAGVAVDEEFDVSVDFISPERPGRYISYWKMASPSDQMFGQRVWVLIQVHASLKDIKNMVRNFNLNSPPASNDAYDHVINVEELEPIVDSLSHSNSAVQTAQSVTQPNVEHEKKFPINDSLLVGDGALSSVSSPNPNSVPYPNIGFSSFSNLGFVLSSDSLPSGVVASPTSCPNSVVYPKIPKCCPDSVVFPKSPAQEIPKEVEIEEKLLSQLENMGFKNKDLNKEVLRLNAYDMVKTVDDLCGAEWDPLLKELHEMGFTDEKMNKMLLEKNNGSIKRVVMDLI